jgi:hypothetical protein
MKFVQPGRGKCILKIAVADPKLRMELSKQKLNTDYKNLTAFRSF